LNPSLKIEYESHANRTNTKSKVLDLQQNSQLLITIAKQEFLINQKLKHHYFLSLCFSNSDIWPTLSFYCVLILVVLIMFSYSYDNFSNTPDRPQLFGYMYDFSMPSISLLTELCFMVLGLLMLCCHLIRIVIDIARIWPIYYHPVVQNTSLNERKLYLFTKIRSTVQKSCKMLKENPRLILFSICLVFCVLGLTVHPFCYIFMMIEVPFRFKILQSVIAAVYIPRLQLFYTFVLYWIIIYIFSL
jgi:inositol 1,4,5-triphosphate receptor type 1